MKSNAYPDAKMDGNDVYEDQPPAEDSPNHILIALNNDCLQECFRRLSSHEDFLNVANVCQRFRANARKCFPPTNIKITSLRPELYVQRVGQKQNEWSHEITSKQLGIFLYHFGDLIKTVHLFGPLHLKEVPRFERNFAKIAQYCERTLKGLSFYRYKSNIDIGTTFHWLESLKIHSNTIIDFLLQPLPHLKVLEIDKGGQHSVEIIQQTRENDSKTIFEQNFPQLEVLILKNLTELNNTIIIDFLTLNPQLRTLQVSHCDLVTTSILTSIDTRLPQLEDLIFVINKCFLPFSVNDDWTHVLKAPNLKSLRTNISGIALTSSLTDLLMKNNVSMERFYEFYQFETIETSEVIYCSL